MAHLVETMAYAGQVPWHGLGNQLSENQPLEVWAQQAGMDWEILKSEAHFLTKNTSNQIETVNAFPERHVLYRSDNN